MDKEVLLFEKGSSSFFVSFDDGYDDFLRIYRAGGRRSI